MELLPEYCWMVANAYDIFVIFYILNFIVDFKNIDYGFPPINQNTRARQLKGSPYTMCCFLRDF